MKTLILYSTREGQTREIATRLGTELQALGRESDVLNLHGCDDIPWGEYDQVVIGASIHYGHFNRSVNQFIAKYQQQLNKVPSAFFSVNLVARKPEKSTPETNAYTRKFLENSPWHPSYCAVFAGALRYPRYGWLDKLMIRLIMKMTDGETDTSKEVVYTDWQQVSQFAAEIAKLTRNVRA